MVARICRDTTVDFVITLTKGKIEELETVQLDNGCNGLEKQFKLYTTCTTTTMHLFDAQDKLKKYEKVSEIIDDYFVTRFNMYEQRKKYLIDTLARQMVILSNKSKYIKEVLEGTIDLRKKKREEVIDMLKGKNYHLKVDEEDYKYLIKLPMDAVTEENVAALEKETKQKAEELEVVKNKTIHKMWLDELEVLEKEYVKYREEREKQAFGSRIEEPKKKKIVVKK